MASKKITFDPDAGASYAANFNMLGGANFIANFEVVGTSVSYTHLTLPTKA